MSDVNLGTVSTQIDIDTSTLSQRVDEVLRALDSIKAGASRASTGMSEAMVNGLADYQKRLEIISQKLVRQRELVEKLNHAQQSATGGNSDKAEKTAAQLEREKTHLMELEAQFDRTQHAQQNFVVEQDKAAKQAVETAKAMDLRKAGTAIAAC